MFRRNRRSVPHLSDRFIDGAEKYLGVSWIRNGRSPSGVDCLGLIILAANDAGVSVGAHVDLQSKPGMKSLVEAASIYCNEVPVREMRRGAILQMHIPGEPDCKHVGIYDGYAIIHCGMHWGRVVKHRLDEKLRRSVKRVWVFKREFE